MGVGQQALFLLEKALQRRSGRKADRQHARRQAAGWAGGQAAGQPTTTNCGAGWRTWQPNAFASLTAMWPRPPSPTTPTLVPGLSCRQQGRKGLAVGGNRVGCHSVGWQPNPARSGRSKQQGAPLTRPKWRRGEWVVLPGGQAGKHGDPAQALSTASSQPASQPASQPGPSPGQSGAGVSRL